MTFPKAAHLLWAALGGLLTCTWYVKNQSDEAKKSRPKKDDADGVDDICNTVGPMLDVWEPEDFESEQGLRRRPL